MAKKRRGNNEGSIYQLPSGSWRAQVSLQGRRISFTAKTKQECRAWINKTLGQIGDGMTFADTQITVDEYLSGWISNARASWQLEQPPDWRAICAAISSKGQNFTLEGLLGNQKLLPYFGKKTEVSPVTPRRSESNYLTRG